MSEELKNGKEELTDETVEKVTGGRNNDRTCTATCPACKHTYTYTVRGGGGRPPCPKCGYIMF